MKSEQVNILYNKCSQGQTIELRTKIIELRIGTNYQV